jgi:hypothetical protein
MLLLCVAVAVSGCPVVAADFLLLYMIGCIR